MPISIKGVQQIFCVKPTKNNLSFSPENSETVIFSNYLPEESMSSFFLRQTQEFGHIHVALTYSDPQLHLVTPCAASHRAAESRELSTMCSQGRGISGTDVPWACRWKRDEIPYARERPGRFQQHQIVSGGCRCNRGGYGAHVRHPATIPNLANEH